MIRAHVLICGGTGCTSSGSKAIQKAFADNIEANGLSEEIKIVQTGCFGLCALGPVVIVYPDGTFYSKVKKDDVAEIVSEHLLIFAAVLLALGFTGLAFSGNARLRIMLACFGAAAGFRGVRGRVRLAAGLAAAQGRVVPLRGGPAAVGRRLGAAAPDAGGKGNRRRRAAGGGERVRQARLRFRDGRPLQPLPCGRPGDGRGLGRGGRL